MQIVNGNGKLIEQTHTISTYEVNDQEVYEMIPLD